MKNNRQVLIDGELVRISAVRYSVKAGRLVPDVSGERWIEAHDKTGSLICAWSPEENITAEDAMKYALSCI